MLPFLIPFSPSCIICVFMPLHGPDQSLYKSVSLSPLFIQLQLSLFSPPHLNPTILPNFGPTSSLILNYSSLCPSSPHLSLFLSLPPLPLISIFYLSLPSLFPPLHPLLFPISYLPPLIHPAWVWNLFHSSTPQITNPSPFINCITNFPSSPPFSLSPPPPSPSPSHN